MSWDFSSVPFSRFQPTEYSYQTAPKINYLSDLSTFTPNYLSDLSKF